MGLDAVELIMAVEEAFDIEIPDWEGRNLSTAGQMYAYVVSRLAFPQRERCISSAVLPSPLLLTMSQASPMRAARLTDTSACAAM